jgi:hypothetical protein
MMIRPYSRKECDSSGNPPLPLRLLRRILIGGKHTIGQHVLIAGDHCGEMAEWLDELGFDVEAIDDSAERLSAKQRSGARFEIHFARLDGTDVVADEPFDLIIADELNLHSENLLCLSARTATAELLARLNPGGELVVVREPGHHNHHNAACWTRHLACFPGQLEMFEYPTPFLSREMLQWMTRGIRPEHFLTVSLRTPLERLSEMEWTQHARRGLLTNSTPCCRNDSEVQRRAA